MRLQPFEILFFASLFSGAVSRFLTGGIAFELLIALFCVIGMEVKRYFEKQKNAPLDELKSEIEQLKSDVSALRIHQGFRGE